MKKHSQLHRHQHPIHWHGSMLLAIIALLLTSFKCSDQMIRALRAIPTPAVVMDSVYMRDPETGHSPVIIATTGRHATYSGV